MATWYGDLTLKLVDYSSNASQEEGDSADIVTLVNLNENTASPAGSSWSSVLAFVPSSPRVRMESEANATDGTTYTSLDYDNVPEQASLLLQATSIANLLALIGNIDRALGKARRATVEGYGYPVYVQAGLVGSDYISRVYDGRLEYDDIQFVHKSYRVRATLSFTRAHFWEGTSDSSIALTNVNGTASTTGITVNEHDDSTNDDLVTLGTVAGDLPTPCIIEVTNNYASGTNVGRFWIGQRVMVASETFTHTFQAESASGGTPAVDATCSSGNRNDVSVSGSDSKLLDWTLSTANMNAFAGRWYRSLLRFQANTLTDLYLYWALEFATGIIWQQDAPTLMSTAATAAIQELGVLRLPPWLIRSINLYPLNLTLRGYSATTGTVGLDYLTTLPLDGYRAWTPRGAGLPQNARLVDNMRTDEFYMDSLGVGGKIGAYNPTGAPIMLYPGATNKLYFKFLDAAAASPIARTISVKIKYRARRRTLGT